MIRYLRALYPLGKRCIRHYNVIVMQKHFYVSKLILVIMGAALLLSACVSVESLPTPTPTPTERPPTATVFFPTLVPTATLTPQPSPTATPDIISGLDQVLFQDRFSTETGWETLETRIGGVSYLGGRFSLAVNEPHTYFSAISPAPVFYDGFIEVQARAALCSEGDSYGLIFRVTPEGDHYRYTLSCRGKVRFSKIFGGEEFVLIPDTQTNSVLSGLLVDNRMAVLLSGDNFRFFLNGVEIFSDQDVSLPAGRVGLMVRARAGGQTTVSFDNFIIRTLKPTPTVTPTTEPSQP